MEFIYTESKVDIAQIVYIFNDNDDYAYIRKENLKERGEVTVHYEKEGEPLIIAGLGDKYDFTLEALRQVTGAVFHALKKHELDSVAVDLTSLYRHFSHKADLVAAWVEGARLGAYTFEPFKAKKSFNVNTVYLVGDSFKQANAVIAEAEMRADSICLARDLANLPANHLHPVSYVEKLKEIFADTNVDFKVYTGDDIEKEELVGLKHVGSGSNHPPAMVEISYRPNLEKDHIVLVGKGVTFDMGGMSLKVVRDLSESRFDMGGSAAVVGAMHYLATTEKDVNVTALLMIAENVPDAHAFLPSTVIEYPNGVSVEVANTDAEGRLILADGLIRAGKLDADEVINICTLTGSVGIALGSDMAGVWSRGQLGQALQKIGLENGDLAWELPLVESYKRFLQSDYADLHNIGSTSEGGATIAALFLEHFVPENTPWAHIDMAATIQARENSGYNVKGATGYGVRLLADYILSK